MPKIAANFYDMPKTDCVLLEIAVFAMRRLSGIATTLQTATGVPRDEAPIGGGMWAGFQRTLSSPYLLNVSLYMLLYTFTSTVLYFQQVDIAATYFESRGARTAFFGKVDLAVNTLTLVTQLFLTSRIIGALGVALTLSILPLFSLLGFAWLGVMPTIAAIVAMQVTRRAGNFAIARPTRELLYTVLSREDKYKAKSFIDTAVYRLGDQIGAWSYAGLGALGLALPGIALQALPVAPRQLPFHAGHFYFELDRGGELWKQLEKTGNLAMHIAGDFPSLELELWAIRR